MNKDVQAAVLSNVLLILSDYTNHSFNDSEGSKDLILSDLVYDSLSLLEIIYELEDKYKVTICPNRLKSLRTISDLVLALDQELKSAA
ncbi:MAG: acyl carrier protein [Pseudohongiellaceae bacterium]|jgi:acyl carrier protein